MSRQKKAPKRGKKQAAVKSTSEIVSSTNECPIDILLDDLVLDIFFNFKLAKIVDLSLVCRKWRQLTLRQEYWRFHSIHQWGKNIVPNSYEFLSGGSIQVDLKKYMIPTFKTGNTTTVDWRKYFKIRFFWEEVKFALDRHYYLIREDFHEPIDFGLPNKGKRTIIMPEGLTTGLSPGNYEEWDENSWSMSDDEDEIEFGEYLDDKEYRKAMKLDEESDDAQSVSAEHYDEDALRKTETHRYTEDLFTESILTFFMRVPRREKAKLDLPERFPRLLSIFSIEVFPLLLEAKFYPALIIAARSIYRCAVTDQLFGKPYEISQDIYELCLLVEDKPKLAALLLFAACYKFKISNGGSETQTTLSKNLMQKFLELTESRKIMAANKAFDKVLEKFVKKFDEDDEEAVIIRSFIEPANIYTLKSENAKLKRSMTKFVDPIKKYELFGIVLEEALPKFGGVYGYHSNEQGVPVLIDFIVSKLPEVTAAQKVVLLTLSDIAATSLNMCLGLIPLACQATKHKNDDVAFAAYTLLFRKMSSSKFTSDFPEKLTKTVFEALLRGLDRFPTNSLCIIVMLTKLLKNKGTLITDKQLKDLNTKILANLAKPEEFFDKEVLVTSDSFLFNKFYKLGDIFGQRMVSYLPKYRKAIMEAGKADLMAALVITKKGDKVIAQMNSSPQRWIQYALLGEYCGAKNFDEDLISFVKEIMEFHNEKRGQDDFSDETEKEFHALFADVIAKIINKKSKNGKQYQEHIENILGTFPAHITEFGKKFFASKLNSNEIYPRKPIPETAAQLEVALIVSKVENEEKAKKKRKKQQQQEISPSAEQLVNYVYSQQYLDSRPKEIEKPPKKKKFKPAFNSIEWQEHGGSNYFETMHMKKEMDQLTYIIAKNNLFDLLDTIPNHTQLLKAFHIILAFAKIEESDDFKIFEHMYQTYDKLRDEFDDSTQCFYIQSMASIMATRLNEKNVHYHIRRVIDQYARKLGTEYFQNEHKNYQPIVGFLAIAIQLDSCVPYDKFFGCQMTYDSIKFMILKSPLSVFRAAVNCPEMSLLFVDHPENNPLDEQYVWRLHSLVLLGHHFGIHTLFSISMDQYFSHVKNRFKFNMLPTKLVDYLQRVDRSKVKPQLIDRMERFLVLFKVYQNEGILSNIRYVNLYNSMYLETETIKKIIRGKKFTTGIAELDKRAKKWENIYDLNKADLYDNDELSSDDEDESEENMEDDDDDENEMDEDDDNLEQDDESEIDEDNSGDDYDEDEMDDDDGSDDNMDLE